MIQACPHVISVQAWTRVVDETDEAFGLWVHADPACRRPAEANIPKDLSSPTILGSVPPMPESHEESTMTTTAVAPKTFAEAEAVLAQNLPGYESRPQQQSLAAFVEALLGSPEPVVGMAEAGCGTGKSLGAMIPAILSGKRTVVATATIALMEQYADKDVPFLQDHLGVPFTWALLKGRSNYVCRAKLVEANEVQVPRLHDVLDELVANPEHDGDREHFGFTLDKREFANISMSSAECPGKKECPFGQTCFAEAAKAKAQASQVVVTNTAMLMTDLKVREATDGWGSMLGDFDAFILDEGHELEEIATSQLEETLRTTAFDRLIKECTNYAATQGTGLSTTDRIAGCVREVIAVLPDSETSRDGNIRLTQSWFVEHSEPFMDLIEAIGMLRDDVMDVSVVRDAERAQAWRMRLLRRCANAMDRYEALLFTPDTEVVRWVENESFRGVVTKVLHYAPINVGPFLAEHLWADRQGVLISATMSVGNDFTYLQSRLGLAGCQTMNVGTPFDYDTQALLFVPPAEAPSPKNRSAWLTYSAIKIQEMVQAAGGGALLLFTSRTALEQAYGNLGPQLEDMGFTCLAQGVSGTNKEIAKTFKEDTHSVLFALKSFFTGVDIPGEACRLVVIDKLPFPVPSEPVFAARADMIKRNRGNDFADLSIPMMTLTLVQGFGRLIRTANDYGVVAILDSRLSGTSWGRGIVERMPDSPATTDLADVKLFFSAKRG